MAYYDSDKQAHSLNLIDADITSGSFILAQSALNEPLGVATPGAVVSGATIDDIQDGTNYKKISAAEKTSYDGHLIDVSNPHLVTKIQVGLGNVENLAPADMPVSTATQTAINDHTSIVTGNPHMVTKTEVGLSNVANIAPADLPVSDDTQAAINSHSLRTDDPHNVTKAQVGLSEVENYSPADMPISDASVAADAIVQSNLDDHEADTSNPHTVTKAQVSLGNVANLAPADMPISDDTQEALDLRIYKAADTASAQIPAGITSERDAVPDLGYFRFNISTNTFEGYNSGGWEIFTTGTTFESHLDNISNPHEVSKAQVGLSDVENYSMATMPIPDSVQTYVDLHINDTTNPHDVTKAQVGLGNVENLAPADMPISTAVQSALDLKSGITHTHSDLDNALVPNSGGDPDTTITPSIVTNHANGPGTDGTTDYWYINTKFFAVISSSANCTQVAWPYNGTSWKVFRRRRVSTVWTAWELVAPQADWNAGSGGGHILNIPSTFPPSAHTHTGVYEPYNTNIQSHISNQSNPHNVTKTQVGLGSVSNLAPADLPVSDDTQTALDLKVAKTSDTGAALLPSGFVADRPIGSQGMLRFNNTSDLLEYYQGTGNWHPASAPILEYISSAITLASGVLYACNTVAGAFSVILPVGTGRGEKIEIIDYNSNFDVSNLTIDNTTNGQTVDGSSGNKVLSKKGVHVTFISHSNNSWRMYYMVPENSKAYGTASFAGEGSEVTIAHGLGTTPDIVNANALYNPGGHLGEVWCRADATNVYVGNSGSYTGTFKWSAEIVYDL